MPATTAPSGEPPRLLSDDEWIALDEDEPGELVDGLLEEEEVPDWIHETVVLWLAGVLRAWAAANGAFVGGSEIKYLLRPKRGRKPDLSMFLAASRRPPRRGPLRRPPDVVVEVVTPTPRDVRRDRIEKMIDYAGFGAKWYWIVDPEARALEVHELGTDGAYRFVLGASEGRVDAPGCAGLAIDLDALWSEIEKLGPPEP